MRIYWKIIGERNRIFNKVKKENIQKFDDILDVIAKGVGVLGGVAAGIAAASMAKKRGERKDLKADRKYELEKEKLHKDAYLKDKQLNNDKKISGMRHCSDVEKTKIMYAGNDYQQNTMYALQDPKMMANDSIMNTSNMGYNTPTQNGGSIESVQSELLKLAEMRKNNLINDEEYSAMKAKVLGL